MDTKMIWEVAIHWHERRLKKEFDVFSSVIKGRKGIRLGILIQKTIPEWEYSLKKWKGV